MTDIVKADGTTESFDGVKLEASLRRVGAGDHTAKRIRQTIQDSIAPASTTDEIYRRAITMLKREAKPAAARYSLRRALFEFGPSGHPFEDFVAEIFKSEGWEVEWRKLVPGKCVMHEVDVYAHRNGENLAAELKYHNDPSYKTDVKVALYVKARFDDISAASAADGTTARIDKGYLITNTKFTDQAIQFARCANIGLMGWSYPTEGNLYDRIIASGIYPVTALMSLRKAEKKLLIDRGIVTCNQLRESRDQLRILMIPPERIGGIVAELEVLCAPV